MSILIKAYIIATGSELLLGTTQDTNSDYIADKLRNIGVKVQGRIIAGDTKQELRIAFRVGLSLADIVIATGGLGPTEDDLTKEIACEAMNCKAELVPGELERIKLYFQGRGRIMPKSNIKQAMFPQEAIILENTRGTASGMWLKRGSKLMVLLPGPPYEMETMYLEQLEGRLINEYNLRYAGSVNRVIKVFGPGESQLEEMLGELITNQQWYKMGLTAKNGEIHIGISVEDGSLAERIQKLEQLTSVLKQRLGTNIFGADEDTLASITGMELSKWGKTVALAESCSGGLLAKMMTDIAGSSRYFWGSVTSYSNEAKQLILGVKESTLNKYGAVSRQAAGEMARGIKELSKADFGVAITGIAGPGGGTEEKPVGLVYVAIAADDICEVKEMRYGGGRHLIRTLAAKTALDLLRRTLNKERGLN